MNLSRRFEEALAYAARIHATQRRKATEVPYVAHLLAVASIALENGAGEEEAIAALLHDAVEDQGGLPRLEEIRARFGDRVAKIVEECSDAVTAPKPPWRARKEAYMEHLRHASPSGCLVSASDKLHNARSILADFRRLGDTVWSRFSGGKEGTLWYYRSLVGALRDRAPAPLVDELNRVVTELERLAGAGEDRDPKPFDS